MATYGNFTIVGLERENAKLCLCGNPQIHEEYMCPKNSYSDMYNSISSVGYSDMYNSISSVAVRLNQQKWDLRFLAMASLVSRWSKDPSTKCGAVIVRPDRTVVSVGFNGFPKAMLDTPELYADREVKLSRILHAELNALLHSREPVAGYTLYTTAPCCDRCAIHAIQSDVKRFVSYTAPEMEARWGEAFKKTYAYYDEAGVEHIEYPK